MRNFIMASCAVIALAGCGLTAEQQAATIGAGQTLAGVAAAHNTTVASLVTKGALFCQKVSVAGPLVVALADISGAPVSVIGQTSTAVAAACTAVGGVPVPPPVDPTSVLVVLPTAL